MSTAKRASLAISCLVLAFAIHQGLKPGAPSRSPYVLPTDTMIVDNRGELDFRGKEQWIRMRHSAAPDVDWRAEDSKTRAARYDQAIRLPQLPSQAAETAWREIGSSNLSGRMHCADYDAASGLLYCASSGGNVWRGDLNGNGWACLNDRLKMADIKSLRVLPLGSTRRIIVCFGKGLYYSDDEGAQWTAAAGLDGPHSWGGLRELVMANDASHMTYVLAEEWDYSNWNAMTTVYRSLDQGAHFDRVAGFAGPTYGNSWKFDIWTDIYGTGQVFLVENANLYSLSGTGATKIATYPLSVPGTVYLTGRQFAGNTYLYVLVSHDGISDVYGSDGTAANWAYRGSVAEPPFMINSFECGLDFDRLFLGGINCHFSNDGGVHWAITNEWYEYYGNPAARLHADICGVNSFRNTSGTELVLLSTDGGMYWSTDGATSVHNISLADLNVSQYYSIYTDRVNQGRIYAGSQDQGYQVGSDALMPTPGGFTQLISGDYGNLSSSDQGQSIWCVYCGFAMYARDQQILAMKNFVSTNNLWLPPIMADPNDPAKAYLGGGRTSGGGAHLYHLSYSSGQISYQELPFDFSPGTDGKISAVASSPINPAYRYVMTSDRKFFSTTDGGNTWTQTSGFSGPPPQFLFGSCILPSPIQLGRIYLSGSGYSNPPVYVSHDNGQTFSPMSSGLPNTLVTSIAADETESVLYAATEVGPYAYLNGSWVDISQGKAPDQSYNTVEAMPETGLVRYGTYGRGIWEFNPGLFKNPIPCLTSLSPSTTTAGGAGFTLALSGADFVSGSIVRWDGVNKVTTFVDSTELQAAIPAADIAAAGERQITVVNPAPGGGVSEALMFSVEGNPSPSLAALAPAGASAGGGGFLLTLSGSDFISASIVRWNGGNRTTTFVSSTQLQSTITAGDITRGGVFPVAVVNPSPGGGTSGPVEFSVSTFTMTSPAASATVRPGEAAIYTIDLTTQYGSFDSPVLFSCTGLPKNCSAEFSPTSVVPGATGAMTTLTLATRSSQAPAAGVTASRADLIPPFLGLSALLSALLPWLLLNRPVSGRAVRRRLAGVAVFCLIVVIVGCSPGESGNNQTGVGTPKGTYPITVRGVSGGLTVSTTITLIVN